MKVRVFRNTNVLIQVIKMLYTATVISSSCGHSSLQSVEIHDTQVSAVRCCTAALLQICDIRRRDDSNHSTPRSQYFDASAVF